MRELDFYNWLTNKSIPKKLCSDYISRLKRLEHSLSDCDIDDEYLKDKCKTLLELFYKSGQNEKMASRHIGNLPIGKYHIASYKYAINKYLEFLKFNQQEHL